MLADVLSKAEETGEQRGGKMVGGSSGRTACRLGGAPRRSSRTIDEQLSRCRKFFSLAKYPSNYQMRQLPVFEFYICR